MSETGDGRFAEKINEGRCPACKSQLIVDENRLNCSVCSLSIINVQKSGDKVLTDKSD
jgi:hypothetical protein